MTGKAQLLSIRDLTVDFAPGSGRLPAVDGISFDIGAREIACRVGESGSGKSMTALAAMGLLPPGTAVTGHIAFAGRDVARPTRRPPCLALPAGRAARRIHPRRC
jgi:ABC-type glutathione transport system ATPase component